MFSLSFSVTIPLVTLTIALMRGTGLLCRRFFSPNPRACYPLDMVGRGIELLRNSEARRSFRIEIEVHWELDSLTRLKGVLS